MPFSTPGTYHRDPEAMLMLPPGIADIKIKKHQQRRPKGVADLKNDTDMSHLNDTIYFQKNLQFADTFYSPIFLSQPMTCRNSHKIRHGGVNRI
jgi:hypothetical protein